MTVDYSVYLSYEDEKRLRYIAGVLNLSEEEALSEALIFYENFLSYCNNTQ